MTRLKNITSNSIMVQVFPIAAPQVNYVLMNPVINLSPGQDIDESTIAVTNIHDSSYNTDLINQLITDGILTRLLI